MTLLEPRRRAGERAGPADVDARHLATGTQPDRGWAAHAEPHVVRGASLPGDAQDCGRASATNHLRRVPACRVRTHRDEQVRTTAPRGGLFHRLVAIAVL